MPPRETREELVTLAGRIVLGAALVYAIFWLAIVLGSFFQGSRFETGVVP
jgi:hypothetical protein